VDPVAVLSEHPFDDELRLVIADQLQRSGDPQGELAIVQQRLRSTPTAELHAREAELIRQVADFPAIDRDDCEQIVGVTWRLGWIERLRLQATGWYEREAEVGVQLGAVLATRAARLIEHVELAIGRWKREVIFEEYLVQLVEAGPHVALRTLETCDVVEFGEGVEPSVLRDISAVYITNRHYDAANAVVGALSRQCPNLEEVRLRGNVAQIGDLVLPRARVFEVCTSALGKEALDGLARATWPMLERLVLWFGDGEYGYGDPCDPDEVARFVRELAGRCPHLGHLAIANSPWIDEILEDLAAAPPATLARLTGLDVSLGTLGPAGAAALVRLRPALPQLATLDVRASYLGRDDLARLVEAYRGCTVLGTRQDVATVGRRYCSVSE
jgi:hypothetical protein